MFYITYRSQEMHAVRREAGQAGPLVGVALKIGATFRRRKPDEAGELTPDEIFLDLDMMLRGLFDQTLMIDNEDAHADDLVKLKRIGCATPVLFENGTTGPQLAYYVGERVLRWLDVAQWNPRDIDNPDHVSLVSVTVSVNGRRDYTYQFSEG